MEQQVRPKNIYTIISAHRSELMGFAALWILFCHTWQLVWPEVPVIGSIFPFLKQIGFCGVDIFFFLSGMGLVRAKEKETTGVFYYRRFRKLVFPVLVFLLLLVIFDHISLLTVLKYVSGYTFYFENIYAFIWFYPAIVTFYLLFPLFYRIMTGFKNKAVLLVAVLAIWLLLSVLLKGILREDLYGFTNRIPVFCIGCVFGTQKNKELAPVGVKHLILAFVGLLIGLILAWLTNNRGIYLLVPESNCCVPNLFLSISVCLLLSFILDHFRFLYSAGQILAFYGTFSLELYVLQEWLFAKIAGMLNGITGSLLVSNLIFLALVTLLSWVLHKLSSFLCDRLLSV